MAAIKRVLPPPVWEVSSSWASSRDAKVGTPPAGAGAAVAKAFLNTGSGSPSCFFGAGVAVAACLDSEVLTLGHRVSLARAGAVAAPCPEDMLLAGQVSLPFAASVTLSLGAVTLASAEKSASAFPAASAARRRADAIGSASGLETGCHAYSFELGELAAGCAGWLPAAGTESGMYSIRAASAGPGGGPGSCSSSKAEDAEAVAAGIEAAPAGLAAAAFLSKPRATRSVPLDCSTLIGLVRTRLAPIRNALATPVWPSTTATVSELWFSPELRALLNSKLPFCSLSQSTTRASKCCAISFLTAANGSVHSSVPNSDSLKTCATTRAVFSSGQNNSAW